MQKIAVIVVNFNSGKMLSECLHSISSQKLPAAKVVVLDNNSSDGSEICVQDFVGVELLRLERNLGFAAACNLGVAMCENCDWVAFLNPDAIAEDGWLHEINKLLCGDNVYASFASRMMKRGCDDVIDGAGDVYHLSGRPRRRFHGEKFSPKADCREEVFSACGGAAIYRRDVFLSVGGFDEKYFCYLEDVDLGFRLQLFGYRCLYVPESVVHHVGSAVVGFRSEFQVYYAHRNIVWTYFKNMPMPIILVTFPLHVALNIYSIFLYAIRGKLRVILRAKRDAIRHFPEMLRQRKGIQKQRTVSLSRIFKILSFQFL